MRSSPTAKAEYGSVVFEERGDAFIKAPGTLKYLNLPDWTDETALISRIDRSLER